MRRRLAPRAFFALSLVAAALACTSEADVPRAGTRADDVVEAPGRPVAPEQTYERSLVFLSRRSDSVFVVPWLFAARVRPGRVEREARGWLFRGGVWDAFFAERWETPPSRAPWRILPRGPVRLIVGEEDALESLVYEEGARQLEITLEAVLAEWSGLRSGSFRLHEGALLLADRRVDGVILDLGRARRGQDPPPGDWLVLASGDSLHLVLEDPGGPDRNGSRPYQGWARLAFREIHWPQVTVDWAEVRAFERARREVPVSWTLSSPEDDLEGILEARASQLEAGQGEGPQLPVDGLFEVAGTVRVEGTPYPVRGLLRHVQP